MIDIVGIGSGPGGDIRTYNTQTAKAANVLQVQLGALEYAKELGIDLKYFLSEDFQFQNDSFKAHLIERLSANNINVTGVSELIETLFSEYTFNIGNEQNTGLVAG